MNEVMIDGKVYTQKEERKDQEMSIVTVDSSGLTYVGLYSKEEPTVLRDARCIIRWGTSEHLAELAIKGPLSNTRLGAVSPMIEFGSGFAVRIPAPGFENE